MNQVFAKFDRYLRDNFCHDEQFHINATNTTPEYELIKSIAAIHLTHLPSNPLNYMALVRISCPYEP